MLGLGLGVFQGHFWAHVIGGIVGAGLLAGFRWLGYVIYGQEVMGGGDVKLMAGLGIILGIHWVLLAIYFSFLIGGIVALILVLFGQRHLKEAMPFGPALILGFCVALYGSLHGWSMAWG